MKTVRATGLKWYKRGTGKIPIWVADERDVKKGYRPKTVNLQHLADKPKLLIAECETLQADMLQWRSGWRRSVVQGFEGTVGSLLDLYENHERSPYHRLKPGSRLSYNHYISKLRDQIGALRISEITITDVLTWHQIWSRNGHHLAAAATTRAVLGAAVGFGTILRLEGCPELGVVLDKTRKKLRNGSLGNVPAEKQLETVTMPDVHCTPRRSHRKG